MPKVEMEKPCAVCESPDHFSERYMVKMGDGTRPVLICPVETQCQQDGCDVAAFWGDGWCFKHHPLNGPIVYARADQWSSADRSPTSQEH